MNERSDGALNPNWASPNMFSIIPLLHYSITP